jgi:hypothetical protein
VDIFFVISGLGILIASLIDSKITAGIFSLRNFWLKRFRRIMPSAVVTVAGYWIDPTPSRAKAGRCIVQTAGYPFYYDNKHPMSYEARFLMPMFATLSNRWAARIDSSVPLGIQRLPAACLGLTLGHGGSVILFGTYGFCDD